MVRGELEDGLTNALRDALIQREIEVPGAPIPGTCSSEISRNLISPSDCAEAFDDPDRDPDSVCAMHYTGQPDPAPLQMRCEARRSRFSCQTDDDCGSERALRRCDRLRLCSNAPQTSCTSEDDCGNGTCVTTAVGRCVDRVPVCYWRIGVERVEVLPSGLEVVFAEDDTDLTFRALQLVAGTLAEEGLCRLEGAPEPTPAAGALGPAPGAP